MTEGFSSSTISDLSACDIQARLSTRRYGRELHILEETTSTNDVAKAALEHVASGATFVTDHQTSGRGSHGRSWSSPKGTDLYLSICDRLDVPLENLPPLALVVGLALSRTIERLLQHDFDGLQGKALPIQVKWPNDVLVNTKKCCGILIETCSTESPRRGIPVVIGIGLNINRTAWPEDLADSSTSLLLAQGGAHVFHRGNVLRLLLQAVELHVDDFVQHGFAHFLPPLAERLAWVGKHVRCGGIEGMFTGITREGFARIQGHNNVFIASSGPLREASR